MGVVREVWKAQVAHHLQRLDELLGFVRRAAQLAFDGVAHERLAAEIAGVEVSAVAPADGAGELTQIDLFDGDLHGVQTCTSHTGSRARTALAAMNPSEVAPGTRVGRGGAERLLATR